MKIVCVLKSGGCYRPGHVYALRDMCKAWMPKHEFVCLTDVPGLTCATEALKDNLAGWWSKMELFRVFTAGDTLFMDLDTILRAPCGAVVEEARQRPFVILRDVSRGVKNPLAMQSSIMWWSGDWGWLYDEFAAGGLSSTLHGDQNFIEHAFFKTGRRAVYWQDITSGVASYKVSIAGQERPAQVPVVVFHGSPRPWQQAVIPYPFPPPQYAALALRKGWVVPRHDRHVLDASLREVQDLDRILSHCKQRRNAFQAGGNIGIWAAALADRFEQCWTAEPDYQNFMALETNTCHLPNLTRLPMALGAEFGEMRVRQVEGNAGAHYCVPGRGSVVAPIDSLALQDLDFLQLDIEGLEHQAIVGAEKTIRRSMPLIVLELKGLGRRYGVEDESTIELLKSWGYSIVDRVARDVIFKPIFPVAKLTSAP